MENNNSIIDLDSLTTLLENIATKSDSVSELSEMILGSENVRGIVFEKLIESDSYLLPEASDYINRLQYDYEIVRKENKNFASSVAQEYIKSLNISKY